MTLTLRRSSWRDAARFTTTARALSTATRIVRDVWVAIGLERQPKRLGLSAKCLAEAAGDVGLGGLVAGGGEQVAAVDARRAGAAAVGWSLGALSDGECVALPADPADPCDVLEAVA